MKFLPFSIVCCLLISALVAPLSIFAYTAPVPTFSPGQSPPPPQPGEGTLGGFQKSLALPGYNKESFDFQSLTGVMSGLTTMLLGCAITNSEGQIDSETCKKLPFSVGAVPAMGLAINSMIANPPASGIQYLAQVGQELQLAKPAYAQTGFGFRVMEPFLPAWRAVRNFTYLFFVVAAIGFGIAIMFRKRVSPQAVITVQSALPGIIVGLVFITFSYAIIGLLIDLVYVVFGLIVWGFHSFGWTTYTPSQEFDEFTGSGFLQLLGWVGSRGGLATADLLRGAPEVSLPGGGLIAALTAIAVVAGGWVTIIPVALGLALALIFFLIRIVFLLARAYLLLLFHIVFAPILILIGVLRGSLWESWLRGALSNLLVFPGVGLIIFFTDQLIAMTPGDMWTPPYIAGREPFIDGLIGIAAIMLIPTLPDVINQLLGVRPVVPFQIPDIGARVQRAIENFRPKPQPGGGGVGGGGGGGACMPFNTLIRTSKGLEFIQNLKSGDMVWTINFEGEKILTTIKFVVKRSIPKNHKMLNITLVDGRSIMASPNHPDANGVAFKNLIVGSFLDNSYVAKIETLTYRGRFIYDLLPNGETGTYWANGILIGSTLFEVKQTITQTVI